MCPACWATAIAAFAGLSVVSILAIALKDRWILGLAIALGILVLFDRLRYVAMSHSIVYFFAALVLARLSILWFKSSRGAGADSVWTQARALAAKTCRTKAQADSESSEWNS